MSQGLSNSAVMTSLLSRITTILDQAKGQAVRSVNSAMVQAYFTIGQAIVEDEQAGKLKAGYGQQLIQDISTQLTKSHGKGYSATNLKLFRQFYLRYQKMSHSTNDPSLQEISHTLCDQLSWSHYRRLLRVKNDDALNFYEKETIANGWSVREMTRQIDSLLFERLAKSRDAEGLKKLSNKGSAPSRPTDIIKDPYILEFLDLPETNQWHEHDLEKSLLNHLQQFLLELGKGFAFVGRQQRLTLDGDHFYPDLVFYHVVLKCYVVIELKVGKLNHADIGQIQMYTHYYDREICTEGDKPTIGLVLCTDKNDAMVKYVLEENQQQIFASRYSLSLPSSEDLRDHLVDWCQDQRSPSEESSPPV